MIEIILGSKAKDHVNISESEVGIKDQDIFPHSGQGHGGIGGYRSLADSAFAAGNGIDPGGPIFSGNGVWLRGCPHGSKCCCLVCHCLLVVG